MGFCVGFCIFHIHRSLHTEWGWMVAMAPCGVFLGRLSEVGVTSCVLGYTVWHYAKRERVAGWSLNRKLGIEERKEKKRNHKVWTVHTPSARSTWGQVHCLTRTHTHTYTRTHAHSHAHTHTHTGHILHHLPRHCFIFAAVNLFTRWFPTPGYLADTHAGSQAVKQYLFVFLSFYIYRTSGFQYMPRCRGLSHLH